MRVSCWLPGWVALRKTIVSVALISKIFFSVWRFFLPLEQLFCQRCKPASDWPHIVRGNRLLCVAQCPGTAYRLRATLAHRGGVGGGSGLRCPDAASELPVGFSGTDTGAGRSMMQASWIAQHPWALPVWCSGLRDTRYGGECEGVDNEPP